MFTTYGGFFYKGVHCKLMNGAKQSHGVASGTWELTLGLGTRLKEHTALSVRGLLV